MRVLFFGTYDSSRHPRVQVLKEGLADRGVDVLECNVPLDVDTSGRLRALKRPWLAPSFFARLFGAWVRLRRMKASLPPVDAVVVGYMGHFDVRLARRLWPHTPILLDHLLSAADTASDRRIRSPAIIRALEWLDRSALRRADTAVVDTEEHMARLAPPERRRAIVVPVGAPKSWFHPPRAHPLPPLRVVFFGLYIPLQGTHVIGDAIRLLAEEPVRFTMIGRGQDFLRCRARAGAGSNVQWIDWMEPGDLPAVVASHHVSLGIFGTGPKARRVVPNKVFQAAAAGCALVTSDTPPQRRALEGGAILVQPGDSHGLADSLRTLAHDPGRLEQLRRQAYELAERSFAPAVVVTPLQRFLADRAAR